VKAGVGKDRVGCVPELEGYPGHTLRKHQNPAVRLWNLDDYCRIRDLIRRLWGVYSLYRFGGVVEEK
jgi:hypothetical protein